MNRFVNRIELIFLAIFGLAIIGIVAYQTLWVAPVQKCESAGNWWEPISRTCGHVIYLPDITHRPIGSKTPPRYPGLPQSRNQAAAATSAPAPVSTAPIRR
jgi:hypothetical protein